MTWGRISGIGSVRAALVVASCIVVTGSLVGCGSSEPRRIPGGGRVTRGGNEVSEYALNFFPDKSVKGSAAATTIMDGVYEFTLQTGPTAPGAYHVVIEEPSVRIPKNERMKGTGKDPPPPRRWEFDYTVPDKGPFTKDFELN